MKQASSRDRAHQPAVGPQSRSSPDLGSCACGSGLDVFPSSRPHAARVLCGVALECGKFAGCEATAAVASVGGPVPQPSLGHDWLRRPTGTEWEKAALWDAHSGATLAWPWGEGPLGTEHADLAERWLYGAALGLIGDVWEWTASDFDGYSGFVSHAYRHYSEVFFGARYKVLRGGSWPASARVATPTVRNCPQRRWIFAGVRLAGEGC